MCTRQTANIHKRHKNSQDIYDVANVKIDESNSNIFLRIHVNLSIAWIRTFFNHLQRYTSNKMWRFTNFWQTNIADFIGSFDPIMNNWVGLKFYSELGVPVTIFGIEPMTLIPVFIFGLNLAPKTKAPIRFFFTFQYFCCVRQRFLEIVFFAFLVNTKTTISKNRSR